MLPAIIFTLLFGILMIFEIDSVLKDLYFYIKIICVIFLFAFHGYMIRIFKQFESKSNNKSASFFRKINEIPTLLMIIIIILVVVKPNLL